MNPLSLPDSKAATCPIPLATHESQSAGSVLMVRPTCFGFNAQTAASNAFQHADQAPASSIQHLAQQEFDALQRQLELAGVRCLVQADVAEPARPDAVFPNNWCSWHADGTLVLYPLLAASRRLERRNEIVAAVCATSGFRRRRTIDLTAGEAHGRYLEGTGSLVLDHLRRVAYACRSPRTDAALVEEWCAALDYRPLLFDAVDGGGQPYYHTNVMMWIGTHCAAVCLEAIPPGQRAQVRDSLGEGRQVIELDRRAVAGFAGNMIELRPNPGAEPGAGEGSDKSQPLLLLMSATARASLDDSLIERLRAQYSRWVVAPVPTIERVGGGSVRCMVAEVPT